MTILDIYTGIWRGVFSFVTETTDLHSTEAPNNMGFDDLHSGADHHYYAHHDEEDFHVSETGERVIIVLSVATMILAVLAIGYIATKERAEHSAEKNQ